MNTDQQRLKDIYDNGNFANVATEEVQILRTRVRKYIFPKVKFLPGEGAKDMSDIDDRSQNANKRAKINSIFGKSHINADLTKERGYAWEILKQMGLTADNVTLEERGMWWKSNQQFVWKEIQSTRGQKSAGIKKCALNGK